MNIDDKLNNMKPKDTYFSVRVHYIKYVFIYFPLQQQTTKYL